MAATLTVAPPRRKPRLGGLLGIEDVARDGSARLTAAEVAQWINDPCGVDYNEVGFCLGDPGLDPEAAKVLQDITSATAATFAGQYGVQCFLGPDADYEERARVGLENTESRFVESKLYSQVLQPLSATGAAGTIQAAFGAAERLADEQYVGLPIIHIGRANVAAAGGLLEVDPGSGQMWTKAGTPVEASSEYPDTSVWVTGWVTVDRGPIVVSSGYRLEYNQEAALAERGYAVLVDCDFAARFDIA